MVVVTQVRILQLQQQTKQKVFSRKKSPSQTGKNLLKVIAGKINRKSYEIPKSAKKIT